MVAKSHGIEDLTHFALEEIRRTGDAALSYYGKGSPEVRFDEELVTEAEIHLTELFQDHLYAQFPEHQLFKNNQENKGYTHEGERYLWIHDTIDGVANFQAGIPIWGISLALLENFWPILGVFHMPATGDIFYARAGGKAYCGDEEIHVSSLDNINDESLLLTYSRFHHQYYSTFPGKIRDLGCTSAHICYVANGRADAAVLANETYQDLAAARVIIEAAGGKICKMNGSEFFLNEYLDGQRIEDHLLVLPPGAYSEVRHCIQETS
ncbi:inositol monophosphatase family protein [Thermodesulfobacteriota bacterium]